MAKPKFSKQGTGGEAVPLSQPNDAPAQSFRTSPTGTTTDTDLVGTAAGMTMTMGQLLSDVRGLRRDVDRHEPLLQILQGAVSKLTADVSALTERVSHLPGKGFIITTVTTSIAILVGLLTVFSHLGWLAAGK